MDKIKLLFITNDFEKYVERNTFYLSQELAKLTDLIVWHKPGNIQTILEKFPFQPDFILLNDLKETRCPEISGLSSLDIPFGIIVHDLHLKVGDRKNFISENHVKHIFVIYRDAFLQTFPEFADGMNWFPHYVNPDIFYDYGLPKEIDWLMMGRIGKYYPLRKKILKVMKDKPSFVYHKHPGYRNFKKNEKEDIFIGEWYAREINRAKMFLTCDPNLHYPLIKYYEVLACNTLLLAPELNELRDLGFKPYVHFVPINRKDFLEKAEYYAYHHEKRILIAQQGYEFVHMNHTVAVRARQLMAKIEEILAGH